VKIQEIRLYHLVAPLPAIIGNAKVFFDRRETLLVEIVSGPLSGWGETWTAPAGAMAVIKTQLASLVLGHDCQHVARLWHDMRNAVGGIGTGMMAVAAIDMALHDLAAREREVPLSTLLGGARRDRVTAYASGPFFKPNGHPYRDFEREITGYIEDGFTGIKLRSGFAPQDDAAAADLARRLIGAQAPLMIDFNQACPPHTAIATAALMDGAKPLWIEEPTSPGDLQGYQSVATHIVPAVAGGETYSSAAEFKPFLETGCMDILQPDIAICGGFTGVAQVAMLAGHYNRSVIPHVWGSIVNFTAALHFVATLPSSKPDVPANFPMIEFDAGPNPLLDLVGRPSINRDGSVSVPSTFGLGVEIQAEALAPYVVDESVLLA
jgi:D-galactarolactone cycloisomerase